MRLLQKNKRIVHKGVQHKRVFFLLVALLLALSSFYGYLAHTTAITVVALRDSAAAVRSAAAALSTLEMQYLSKKRTITLSLAYRDGFEDARSVTFITRKALSAARENNEI